MLETDVEYRPVDRVPVVTGQDQRVRGHDRHPRHRLAAPLEVRESAVTVLQGLESLDVGCDLGVEFVRSRQAVGIERIEHVAQCGDGHDPPGVSVGRVVPVVVEVEHCIGQRLEGGRRGRDLESAELGEHPLGSEDRLGDRCVVVDDAVGGERLGRRRCVHRQIDRGGVGEFTRGGRDPEAGGADVFGRHREPHLDPVVRRNDDPGADSVEVSCGVAVGIRVGSAVETEVRRLDRHVDLDVGVGLVLDDDGEFEAVAEVEEAGSRRTHCDREAGGDGRLAGTELVDAVDGDGHHAVAGEVVGKIDVDRDRAVGSRGLLRSEHGERVEIGANVDGRRRLTTRARTRTTVRGDLTTGRILHVERRRLVHGVGRFLHRFGVGRRLGLRSDVLTEQVGVGEDDALANQLGRERRSHAGVERVERIGEFVPTERQHGLVDDDENDPGIGDRSPVGVGHGHLDGRRRTRLDLGRRRRRDDVKRP